MSVTIVSTKDAITIVDDAQGLASQVTNFFDFFGTTGCLLNCENERTFEQNYQHNKTEYGVPSRQQRKGVSRERREYRKQYHESRQEWFTISQVTASAGQGCGSCSVLKQILQNLFSENKQGLSGEYEYSVSLDFILKRRPWGGEEPVETIQLFQPRGLSLQFERFYRSNILCGKDISMTRLRQWMNECLSSHVNCPKHTAALNDNHRPARLLSLSLIQRDGEYGIRLIETVSGTSYQYACLSHRWDEALEHHQTTAGNLSKFLDFLNLNELPGNFRDAVSIARDLDIQYLWIDSLCIIQRGDNNNDLHRELAKMGSIYQNAHLTIAAISSPNSSEGCFMQDKWPDICFLVSNTNTTHLIGARVLDKKGQLQSINDITERYPLLRRAWVLQERLLSPRLLQCNYGEFTFECLECSRCECSSIIAPHPRDYPLPRWWKNSIYRLRRLMQDTSKREALEYWKTTIQLYMRLELSFPSDVMSAIAGCAQVLALHLGFNYVAGMWKEMLSTDLLWCIEPNNDEVSPRPRPKDSTAPSWSWASVSMGQTISHGTWLTSDALLRDAIKLIYCEPMSVTNPFDKLKDAYLMLEAVLYPWYFREFCVMARKKRWRDLYIRRSNKSTTCATEIQELVVDGLVVECNLDVRLQDEGLVAETFSHCISDPPQRCRLIQIYLLHALHKENLPRSVDVFLLLMRTPPVNGKPNNCYRRIGLIKLRNEHANVRTSEEMFQSKMEPRKEEFWLF